MEVEARQAYAMRKAAMASRCCSRSNYLVPHRRKAGARPKTAN
jgi:hypothetical protein